MRLSRKKAIKLCIDLWTWLAKTGKKKDDWPGWDKYGYAMNHCWFCAYATQRRTSCHCCPLIVKLGVDDCFDTFYGYWDIAKTPRTRKKYAKLFLGQIKKCK